MAAELHRHSDFFTAPGSGYGYAVTNVDEHGDGTLWVGNGEYASQVSFCPFCGYEAKVKAVREQEEMG